MCRSKSICFEVEVLLCSKGRYKPLRAVMCGIQDRGSKALWRETISLKSYNQGTRAGESNLLLKNFEKVSKVWGVRSDIGLCQIWHLVSKSSIAQGFKK